MTCMHTFHDIARQISSPREELYPGLLCATSFHCSTSLLSGVLLDVAQLALLLVVFVLFSLRWPLSSLIPSRSLALSLCPCTLCFSYYSSCSSEKNKIKTGRRESSTTSPPTEAQRGHRSLSFRLWCRVCRVRLGGT